MPPGAFGRPGRERARPEHAAAGGGEAGGVGHELSHDGAAPAEQRLLLLAPELPAVLIVPPFLFIFRQG